MYHCEGVNFSLNELSMTQLSLMVTLFMFMEKKICTF